MPTGEHRSVGTFVGPDDTPDLYELVAHIGEGGEAQVWRAITREATSPDGITVAVKIFNLRDEATAREWLQRTQVLRHVVNPGLAATLNVFVGSPMHRSGTVADPSGARLRYLVMEFVGGPSLQQWVEDNPAATTRQRLDTLLTVAAALDTLHAGTGTTVPPVAHGDIKPDNIRLTAGGGIKLVDFGLMRLAAGRSSGPAIATAPYTAPEIFNGALPTPETDRFSFAATLFQVVTGEVPPLRADGRGPDTDLTRRALTMSPLTAQRPELCSAIMAGLAPSPQDRPARLVPWVSSVRSSSTVAPTVYPATQHGIRLSEPASAGAVPAKRRLRPRVMAAIAAALLIVAAVAAWGLTRRDGGAGTGSLAGLTASAGATGATPTPAASLTPSDQVTPTGSSLPASTVGSPSSSESADIGSASPPVNLGDSRQGMTTTSNGFSPVTQVTINAKTFTYGFAGCQIACGSASIDINLGRSYSTLTARLGAKDSSKLGGSAHIQVLADGNVIASETVKLGTSRDISVSVKNVLRLQFVESNDGGVVAAVGDPTVIP